MPFPPKLIKLSLVSPLFIYFFSTKVFSRDSRPPCNDTYYHSNETSGTSILHKIWRKRKLGETQLFKPEKELCSWPLAGLRWFVSSGLVFNILSFPKGSFSRCTVLPRRMVLEASMDRKFSPCSVTFVSCCSVCAVWPGGRWPASACPLPVCTKSCVLVKLSPFHLGT